MQTVQIFNVTKGVVIAQQAKIASSLGERMKGLLGKRSLSANEALILKPCSSIHTFFMRFPIDIIFLDRDSKVKRVIQNMPPFRLSRLVFGAREVIELPSGVIANTKTEVDDLIEIQP